MATWSYAFEKYSPQTIIEIGTGTGGFTNLLGIQAWNSGAFVHTFDIDPSPTNALSAILPIIFYREDCFGAEQKIAELINSPGRTYLLCDGGDKPREFNTFAKYLKPGDIIAAHDYFTDVEHWWWNEITNEDVAATVKEQKLEPFMVREFDKAGWLAFKK